MNPMRATVRMMDDQSSELDGIKIRRLAAGRRAAIRLRTYLLVGIIGCLVAMLQTLVLIVLAIRSGDWPMTALWISLVVLLLIVGCLLFGRLRRLSGQIHQPIPSPPLPPPDFGPLSDGSQHWKNLEQ